MSQTSNGSPKIAAGGAPTPHRDIAAEVAGNNALAAWYAAIDPKRQPDQFQPLHPGVTNANEQWQRAVAFTSATEGGADA